MRGRLRHLWFALVPFEAVVLWVAFLPGIPFKLPIRDAWYAAVDGARLRASETRR